MDDGLALSAINGRPVGEDGAGTFDLASGARLILQADGTLRLLGNGANQGEAEDEAEENSTCEVTDATGSFALVETVISLSFAEATPVARNDEGATIEGTEVILSHLVNKIGTDLQIFAAQNDAPRATDDAVSGAAGVTTLVDVDGNHLMITSATATGAMIEIAEDGFLSVTPDEDASGQIEITLTVSDGELSDDSRTFFDVDPSPDGPVEEDTRGDGLSWLIKSPGVFALLAMLLIGLIYVARGPPPRRPMQRAPTAKGPSLPTGLLLVSGSGQAYRRRSRRLLIGWNATPTWASQ